jgi:hypothetical protein
MMSDQHRAIRRFCLYTSPGFWMVVLANAVYGAVCGAIYHIKPLFK